LSQILLKFLASKIFSIKSSLCVDLSLFNQEYKNQFKSCFEILRSLMVLSEDILLETSVWFLSVLLIKN
jgi:hypothetical protein